MFGSSEGFIGEVYWDYVDFSGRMNVWRFGWFGEVSAAGK